MSTAKRTFTAVVISGPSATIAATFAAGRTVGAPFEDYASLPVDGIEAVRRRRASSQPPRD